MMDEAFAIQKCREGEREAFRYLVEQYQSQAISHAVAILGDREDALDAVQESFLDAFQSLDRFDPSRKFYPWFYVILRNRCYKLFAARRKRETSSLEDAGLLALTTSQRPEELLSLNQALSELTPEERELITLKHLDGLSYEELAERLEIPDGTVMSRLYHARKRLHGKLTRRSTKHV